MIERLSRVLLALGVVLCGAAAGLAGSSDRKLDVYWIDVEGGAATLIVTPSGDSILVDAGNPGVDAAAKPGRDAARILWVAKDVAGLDRIDTLVVTHHHIDHFGGVAELAEVLPIGTIYENPLSELAPKERGQPALGPYEKAPVRRRRVIEPGADIPLPGRFGSVQPRLQFVGTRQQFVPVVSSKANAQICASATRKDDDPSDNAMSAVLTLRFGEFRMFLGGDITWNVEEKIACPEDLVGTVDVYQSTHHGFDNSNNPVLLRTLAPSVVVFTNGTHKGLGSGTVAAVRALPSLKAVFQLHKGLADGAMNTEPGRIANMFEACKGAYVKLAVDPEGKKYVVTLPSTGLKQSFDVRKH
jgi:competence protein ComEC